MALYSLHCADVPLRNCSLTPHENMQNILHMKLALDRNHIMIIRIHSGEKTYKCHLCKSVRSATLHEMAIDLIN